MNKVLFGIVLCCALYSVVEGKRKCYMCSGTSQCALDGNHKQYCLDDNGDYIENATCYWASSSGPSAFYLSGCVPQNWNAAKGCSSIIGTDNYDECHVCDWDFCNHFVE